MGRTPTKEILKRVEEVVAGSLVPVHPNELAAPTTERHQAGSLFDNSRIARIPGLEDAICELKYAGASTRKIAGRVGLSHEMVRRYLNSDRFARAFDQRKDALDARVSEFIRRRVQENVLGTLDDLLRMRDGAKGWLRRQLNMDILQLNEKYAGVGGVASAAGQLRATHERLVRRGKGQVEKFTTVVTGSRDAVAAAIAEAGRQVARRAGDNLAGEDGKGVGNLDPSPTTDRDGGAPSPSRGPGDCGAGGGGVQVDGEPAPAQGSGGEQPTDAEGD